MATSIHLSGLTLNVGSKITFVDTAPGAIINISIKHVVGFVHDGSRRLIVAKAWLPELEQWHFEVLEETALLALMKSSSSRRKGME